VFGLIAASDGLFEVREIPQLSYRRSMELLAKYVDQAFSWVDAILLLTVDDDRRVNRLLTVDASLALYRFSHEVAVSMPAQ
jgi:hypothetical protein